ncbi:hypothetical protein cyc_04373 [Cyclospora cayetanensis]|uniref:Uncharacterized protein n=1 Tax=Cyclospora cayetanensis TaxID=88456 RepID=A0A1D3CY37_9EIME|nr:hypothetical protein cyc_04373 [Cyclospora cayetanensis]
MPTRRMEAAALAPVKRARELCCTLIPLKSLASRGSSGIGGGGASSSKGHCVWELMLHVLLPLIESSKQPPPIRVLAALVSCQLLSQQVEEQQFMSRKKEGQKRGEGKLIEDMALLLFRTIGSLVETLALGVGNCLRLLHRRSPFFASRIAEELLPQAFTDAPPLDGVTSTASTPHSQPPQQLHVTSLPIDGSLSLALLPLLPAAKIQHLVLLPTASALSRARETAARALQQHLKNTSSSTSSVLLVLLDFESPQLARHLKSCYAPALRGSRCPPLLMQQQHKRGSESCVHWEVSAAATEETAVPPEQGSQEVTTSLQQHFLWIRSYRSALLYMLRQLLEHYHIAFPALAAVQPPCAAATGVAAAQAAAAVTSSRLPLNVLYRAAVCVAITGLQHAAAATALHALACGVAGAASRVWLRGVALALEAEAALVVAAVEPASVWSKAGAAEERRVAAFGLAVRKAFSCWRECLLQLQRHRSIWRMQQPRSCSSLPPLPPLALFIKGRMQLASLLHSFAAFCLGALHDANVYSCQNNASNDEARDAGDAAVSRSADNVVQVASSSAVHGTASAAAAVEDATFAVRCQELEKLRQSARAALQKWVFCSAVQLRFITPAAQLLCVTAAAKRVQRLLRLVGCLESIDARQWSLLFCCCA